MRWSLGAIVVFLCFVLAGVRVAPGETRQEIQDALERHERDFKSFEVEWTESVSVPSGVRTGLANLLKKTTGEVAVLPAEYVARTRAISNKGRLLVEDTRFGTSTTRFFDGQATITMLTNDQGRPVVSKKAKNSLCHLATLWPVFMSFLPGHPELTRIELDKCEIMDGANGDEIIALQREESGKVRRLVLSRRLDLRPVGYQIQNADGSSALDIAIAYGENEHGAMEPKGWSIFQYAKGEVVGSAAQVKSIVKPAHIALDKYNLDYPEDSLLIGENLLQAAEGSKQKWLLHLTIVLCLGFSTAVIHRRLSKRRTLH